MRDIKFEEDVKKEEVKRFPVKMKHGYFPADPEWPKDPATGWPQKIKAGSEVSLPIEEARKLIKAGHAERNDGIEI